MTCPNLDNAITIVESEKTTLQQKAFAGGYILTEGAAHGGLLLGAAGIGCGLTPTCVTAVSAILGLGSADGDPTNELRGIVQGGKTLIDGLSKQEVRDALKSGIDGLSKGQIKEALEILRSGKIDSITVNQLKNNVVQIITERQGTNGFQQMIYTLDSSGKVTGLIQKAFNAAGELVHYHDKLKNIIDK